MVRAAGLLPLARQAALKVAVAMYLCWRVRVAVVLVAAFRLLPVAVRVWLPPAGMAPVGAARSHWQPVQVHTAAVLC